MKRLKRALVGDDIRLLGLLLVPTLLAIAIDLVVRGRALAQYPPIEIENYVGGAAMSACFWGGPLWIASRLFVMRARWARIAIGAVFTLWILPLTIFAYGGQVLHYRVFHSYMGRDTIRLGIALRGTLGDWFSQFSGVIGFVGIFVVAVGITYGMARIARRVAPALAVTKPIVPVVAFIAAIVCLWNEWAGTRGIQSVPPDTCFAHGLVHAVRDRVTGKGWVRQGIAVRTPSPLPALAIPAHRPNVIFVITESVRADAMCSEPPPGCVGKFLDPIASDRLALGKLTTQSPGTFSSCMLDWTGLPPTVDFQTAHRAATLWEVAKAVGYRTAYVTSQNMQYEDFGMFVQRAGIDVSVSGVELGHVISQQIGAPDERATARLLDFIHQTQGPYFAVLHFSNTHAPYRVEPDLEPFAPHSEDALGDAAPFHAHYSNSVLLQERTLAAFIRDVRALPSWNDTAIVFVSDHGEQFREHGGLYHLHTLYDEEVRVPGFLVAGPNAVDMAQREAVHAYSDRRTYSQDVNATVLDLLGVFDERARFPFASLLTGRSILRAPPPDDPIALMSTGSGVWEPNELAYGAMRGERKVSGAPGSPWTCFHTDTDPREYRRLAASACGPLVDVARAAFTNGL